jgi:hypothetical protein
MCLRRLLLMVMMRGALSDAMLQECVTVLLDAFGAHHIHTLTNLEAAGPPPPCSFLPFFLAAAFTIFFFFLH